MVFELVYCKSTKYNENLMLMNLTEKKQRSIKMIVNKCSLLMRKLYRQYLPREAATRGLLEVSWPWRLRKTSSSSPSGEGCREQQLRQVS